MTALRHTQRLAVRISACLAVLGVALLAQAATPGLHGTATAAVCTPRTGVSHNDSNGGVYGMTWTKDSVCPNSANAPIYIVDSSPENQNTRIGTMLSTSSWFVCWVSGAQHAGGNSIWYYTQGDVAAPGFEGLHAWGFMPARYVFTTNDPQDSKLPPCPFSV